MILRSSLYPSHNNVLVFFTCHQSFEGNFCRRDASFLSDLTRQITRRTLIQHMFQCFLLPTGRTGRVIPPPGVNSTFSGHIRPEPNVVHDPGRSSPIPDGAFNFIGDNRFDDFVPFTLFCPVISFLPIIYNFSHRHPPNLTRISGDINPRPTRLRP